MVMEPGVFDYIDGDDQPLEREPFERLAADCQMMGYIHEGFWSCMDTPISGSPFSSITRP